MCTLHEQTKNAWASAGPRKTAHGLLCSRQAAASSELAELAGKYARFRGSRHESRRAAPQLASSRLGRRLALFVCQQKSNTKLTKRVVLRHYSQCIHRKPRAFPYRCGSLRSRLALARSSVRVMRAALRPRARHCSSSGQLPPPGPFAFADGPLSPMLAGRVTSSFPRSRSQSPRSPSSSRRGTAPSRRPPCRHCPRSSQAYSGRGVRCPSRRPHLRHLGLIVSGSSPLLRADPRLGAARRSALGPRLDSPASSASP